MIKSMTGYGKKEAITESFKVTVEIRTLNSKQLDINLRIPQILKEKEIEIRKAIGLVLRRGKIDTFVSVEQNS
ncbi:MAG: YicC/YloC family endoribonuclease, partial [Bacteroidota bacterium]